MRLAELSEASGTSTASIKFYLRSGLLEAGDAVHPTRAEYGERHVRRLQLIQGLRSAVGLGLEDIRRIVDASHGADDSSPQRLALLATVQSVVLGYRGTGTGTGESAVVDGLVRVMGWPDEHSEARDAVGEHLAVMEAAGVATDPAVLASYARAADAIAGAQLAVTGNQGSVEDLILTAAIGLHLHNQLILTLVALAQASHSIRRYGDA
jgi:DNA-binding transcriptional MerR regulator